LYYDNRNNLANEFKGRLKLNNDPKFENIDNKNVILKGSILYYTDWSTELFF